MTSEKLDEKSIFNVARRIESPEARAKYLRQVCGPDADLMERVETLLSAYEEQASFLEAPAADLTPATDQSPIVERPGAVIGAYKLLQQIGEGGMGVVFMAEQTEPIQRTVALKIIKPGMDTRQVIARFEAERQAVAMMDHPNIAKVLDAGTTNSGRPYFVMELVRGVPITKYCDEKQLPLRARLELFVQVCQAVQHAHQKGIIHRDIKPNNVLVAEYDNRAVPKVIDFGVAKATAQRLTERTMFTEFGQVLGTMEYMSPEQSKFNQLDIDTRCDIYSLGVLLYELLAGSTPFEGKRLHAAAFDEMLRIIREEEPPKPSTRLSSIDTLPSVAVNRHTEPARLSKDVRGELDWIVMKALEKDRNRRYATASSFATDLQRHLHDDPVEAGPPSAAYRFRKFTRRNKVPLTFTALVVLALLTLTGGIGWNMRDRAARQTAVEQEVNLALREAAQWQEQAKWPEALSAAKRAEGLLAGGGSDELRERVHQLRNDLDMVLRLQEFRAQRGSFFVHKHQNSAYARLFAEYGIDVESLNPPEIAARIARRPATAVRMAGALDDWAQILRDWGLHDRTRDPATWKRLLEAARLADPDPWRGQLRQLMGQDDLSALRKLADASDVSALPVQSLQQMGNALIFAGDGPACVAWLRKAHRQHPDDALISFDLAWHLSHLPSANWAEVLRFGEAGLAAEPSPPMYDFVGNALIKLRRHEEAVAVCRKAIQLKPDFDRAHNHLGIALARQGKLEEAIACYRRAIELKPDFAWAHSNLGEALVAQGKLGEGIACYRKSIELNPTWIWAHKNLGSVLDKQGKLDESATAYREAIRLKPDDHPSYAGLGFVLMRTGDLDGAIDCYHKAIELQPDFAWAHNQLGNALATKKDFHGAIAAYSKGIQLKPNEATYWRNRGSMYAQLGQHDEAIADYSRVIELQPDDPVAWYFRAVVELQRDDLSGYRQECARMLERFEQSSSADAAFWTTWTSVLVPEALADWTKSVKLAEKAHAADGNSYDLINQLGCVLYRAGRIQEAAMRLAEADAAFTQTPSKRSAIVYNWFFQAMAHHRLGHTAEAASWLEKALQEIDDASPEAAQDLPTNVWNRRLTLKLLRREAQELLARESE